MSYFCSCWYYGGSLDCRLCLFCSYTHYIFIDVLCLFFERPNEKSFLKQFKTKGWRRSSLSSLRPFTGTLMTLTTLHFKRMLCFRAVLTTFYVLETHSGLSASGNMAPFPWHQGLSSGRQTSSQALFFFFFSFCCRVKLSGCKTDLTSILNPHPKILQSFNGEAEGSW